jgi:phytoene dehydrogenase-like protein
MGAQADTVIIGGGIGGVALGALLAAAGERVVLVEKNRIIGGRCLSYERDGFTVDLGVHLFGLGGKGPLGEVCRRAGEPDAIEWVLARNPRVAVHFRGVTRPFSREVMMENVDKKNLGPLANIFVKVMQMKDEELDALWHVSLLDWLTRFTADQSVHGSFAMLCGIYLCITPDQASAAEFIVSLRGVMRMKSSAYPRGGCVAVPRAYQRIIEKHGGEVRLGCPAERIIIEAGRARGVIAGGETISARRVVSNADIKATIGGLAAAGHFPADYVKRVQGLTYTAHVVALKVALDTRITDQKMIMYMPDLSDQEIEELKKNYLEGKPMPYVAGGMLNSPTNFDPELAPPGHQLLFFGTRCERDQDWGRWETIMLEALEKMFPDMGRHVLWTTVDSPDVIDGFAGEDGNVIGVGQTVDQVHGRRPAHETPVSGLFLCSAEAGGHGIGTELAASSALELADKLLKKA